MCKSNDQMGPTKNSVDAISEKIDTNGKAGFPKRYIVVLLCSLATLLQYTIRVNLSVTIVAMVNDTYLSGQSSEFRKPVLENGCPFEDTLYANLTNSKSEKASKTSGEFNWAPSTQGAVLGAFYYGYILTHINSGQLAEWIGAKRLIAISILTSSVLTLLTPIAAYFNVIAVIAIRVVTGMSQGVMSPAIYTLYANWVPSNERSTALASYLIGGYIGTIMTMPLSAYLCEHGFAGGWPSVFYVLGILGCVCLFGWLFLVYETPTEHSSISEHELLFLRKNLNITAKQDKNKKKIKVPWVKILVSPQMWLIAIAKFSYGWGTLLFMSKLPAYLESVLHFSIEKNGFINAMAYVAISVSLFLFGSISDFIDRKKLLKKSLARRAFESLNLFGAAGCALLIPFVGCNSNAVVTLIMLTMVFYGAEAGGDNPIVVDVAPDYSGSLYGITNAIGSIPGFLVPVFVGFLLDNNPGSIQSWNIVFYVSAAVSIVGGICFLGVSAKPQPWGTVALKAEKKASNDEENAEIKMTVTVPTVSEGVTSTNC
ncbi:Sialin-like protein [Dinothrombium tinctorium]|uniref:Sialin-like protein n=1 Tax=Dinothrombium tinctorium TaxID=1965070 RepID=A0A3S3S1J7_9ACAR|nr:Sialin-like protein [Dinothrombium tinctorium]